MAWAIIPDNGLPFGQRPGPDGFGGEQFSLWRREQGVVAQHGITFDTEAVFVAEFPGGRCADSPTEQDSVFFGAGHGANLRVRFSRFILGSDIQTGDHKPRHYQQPAGSEKIKVRFIDKGHIGA
jgi:hypothetical protein